MSRPVSAPKITNARDPKSGFAYEIIEPPNPFRDVLTPGGKPGIDHAAIERAEAAYAELKDNFDDWIGTDIVALTAAAGTVGGVGISGDAFEKIYRAAHDLRADGRAFGQPRTADAADSLCVYLDAARVTHKLSTKILRQFVNAILAISQNYKGGRQDAFVDILVDALKVMAGERREAADAVLAEAKENPATDNA